MHATHGVVLLFLDSQSVLGPILVRYLIEAMGGDYGVIFAVAGVTFAAALLLMLGVHRGERADQAVAAVIAE